MWTVNFQMFRLDLEKAEESEINLPTFVGSSKKQESSRKTYFCFIDNAEAFDCVNHNQLWKILQEMGIPDHLICLLRNLYAGQEATVKIGHGTTDWFQIGKGVRSVFLMMYSTYKLNKQGDNRQPWRTPFPIWNQSFVSCPVLTVASWHAYRFLKRQVRWSGIPISFRIFRSLLWSTQSKALA